MRKLFLCLTALLLALPFGFSQNRMTITENFDKQNSCTFTRVPQDAWVFDTLVSTSGKSVWGFVPTGEGDSIELISPVYDFTKYSYVIMRFSHICKVSDSDLVQVMYRENIPGAKWTSIPASSYMGSSSSYRRTGFSQSSYAVWEKNNLLAEPEKYWWQTESFDVSPDVALAEVQFKFMIKKGAQVGTNFAWGWLIDNFELVVATSEIRPPVVEIIAPSVKGTVYEMGPHTIYAKAAPRTLVKLQTPQLFITYTSPKGIKSYDTLAMANVAGDSIWSAEIPLQIVGTQVDYTVFATDTVGNNASASSAYNIGRLWEENLNCVAILSIDTPLIGALAGQTTPLAITIQNRGKNTLVQADIEWTLNGVAQKPLRWTGVLEEGITAKVNVGTYIPTANHMDTIVVKVSAPNAATNNPTDNYQLEKRVYGCSTIPSGTFTIAPGKIGDMLEMIRSCGTSGDVTMLLEDGVYNEYVDLTDFQKYMAPNSKLTIMSKSGNAKDVVLQSDTLIRPVIMLQRTNNIIIKNLTLSGKGSGIVMNDTNNNVEISRCDIQLDTLFTTNNYGGIVINNEARNIRIADNRINGSYYGLKIAGANHLRAVSNVVFNNNIVSNAYYGNQMTYTAFDSVYNNVITARSSKAAAFYGLYMTSCSANGVVNNRIHAVANVTGGYGIYLSAFNQDSVSRGLFANNEILINTTSNNTYGINMTTSRADFYHNTVVMYGNGSSRALNVTNGTKARMNFSNNIFVCYNNGYPAYFSTRNYFGTTLNLSYNNYYGNTYVGYIAGAMNNLNAWTNSSREQHAANVNPMFQDYTVSGKCRAYTGMYCPMLADVPFDILDSTRNLQTAMGCYSADSLGVDAALSEFVGWPAYLASSGATPVKVKFMNAGGSALTAADINWSVNGVAQTPMHWTGLLNPYSDTTLTIGNYQPVFGRNHIRVWISGVNGQGIDNNQGDDTIANSVFACGQPLKGDYNVGGANADFATVDEAITMLNNCKLGGNVTLKLAPGHYPAMKFDSNTIRGMSNTAWVKFTSQNDSDRAIIDGIAGNMSSVGNAPYAYAILLGGYSQGLGVAYYHFDNLILDCPKSVAGISICGSSKTPVHDIKVTRCLIQMDPEGTGTQYGVHTQLLPHRNIEISNNHFDGGAAGISLSGNNSKQSTGHRVDSNVFINQYSSGSNVNAIVSLQNSSYSSFSYNTIICRKAFATNRYLAVMISGAGCKYICNNYIDGYNTAFTNQFRGLQVSLNYQQTGDTCLVANNFVKGYSSGNPAYGITCSNARFNVYHNTVYVRGDRTSQNGSNIAGIVVVPNKDTNTINVKNNNICVFGIPYTFYTTNKAWTFLDHNNFYSAPTTVTAPQFAYIQGNLKDFNAVKAYDTAAVNVLPEYLNIETGGQYIARPYFECSPLVKEDYNGDLRPNPTHIGAYNGLAIVDNAVMAGLAAPGVSGVTGKTEQVTVLVKNNGDSTITTLTLNWSINGVAQNPVQWKGSIAPKAEEKIDLGNLTWVAGLNRLVVVSSLPNGHADQTPADDTLSMDLFGCAYAPLNGKYTVGGAGAHFATLEDAVSALNYCNISGPVTMELATGSYSAIKQVGEFMGATAQHNVTFVSQTGKAADVVIGATEATAVSLNAVRYVTFRNLTIGTPTSTQVGVELKGDNVGLRFEHCSIYADTNSTSGTYPVYQNSGSCDSVFFVGNDIVGGVTNVQLSPLSGPGYGLVLDSNNLLNAYSCGISSNSGGHVRLIAHNYIRSRRHTTVSYTGINWNYSSKFDTIANNRVYIDNVSGQAKALAVSRLVRDGAGMVINNEFLINSSSVSSSYGMYYYLPGGGGPIGSEINLVHNTFYVSGKGVSYGLYYINNLGNGFSPNTYVPSKPVKVMYNNLYIDANANSAAIYYDLPEFAAPPYVEADYNNYYNNNGVTLGVFGADRIPMVYDFAAFTRGDAHSVSELPIFTDLHNSLHTDGNRMIVMVDDKLVNCDLDGKQRQAKDFTNIGCYHDYVAAKYDVEMAGVVSPIDFTTVGKPVPVEVKITNLGSERIDSVEIHWMAGSQVMPTYMHRVALAHGETSMAITIGSFVPVSGMNQLVVWTEKPNSNPDAKPGNDTASAEIMGCASALAGTYRVGKSAAADYKTLDMAFKALNYCGMSGSVVFALESGVYDKLEIVGEIKGCSEKATITITSVDKDSSLVVIGGNDAVALKLKSTGHLVFKQVTIGSTDPQCEVAVQFQEMITNVEFSHCNLHAGSGLAVLYENEKGSPFVLSNVRFIGNEINGAKDGIRLVYSGSSDPFNFTQDSKTPSWVQIDSNHFVGNGNSALWAENYNHITSFSHNTIETSGAFGVFFSNCNLVDSMIGNKIRLNSDYMQGIVFQEQINTEAVGKKVLPVRVVNNEIKLINRNGGNADGIFAAKANVELVHNTVYANTLGANVGIRMEKQEDQMVISACNNIISCEGGKENYAIFCPMKLPELMKMGSLKTDNNVYYTGMSDVIFCEMPMTLTDWVKESGMDVNSKVAQPIFANPSKDLSINQFSVDFRCVRDKVVTTDINGNARTALTVVGAYSIPLYEGYDLSLNAFVEPVQDEIPCVPNVTPVKVSVYNLGTKDIDFKANPMKLYFKCESDSVNVNNSITINSGLLEVMGCDTFEVLTNLDIRYVGVYKLTAWLDCAQNDQKSNDTLVMDYQVNKTILPYDNDFSGSFVGVKMNQVYGNIGWEVSDTVTALNPAYGDHRAIFRSSESRGSISQILFSSVRLQGSFRPQLYFWYAHDNANPNMRDQMDVRISQDGGATFKTIGTVYRYDAKCTQPTWKMHHIDLSNYTTGSCIVLSFMAYSYGGGDQALDLVRLVAMQDMALTVDVPSDTDFYACNLSGNTLTAYLENQTSQEVPFSAGDSITVMMSGASNFVYKQALSGRLEDFEIDTLQLGPIDYVGGGQFDVMVYVNSIDSNRANDTVKFSLNLNPDLAIVSSDPIGLTNPGDTLHAGITLKNVGNLDIVSPFDVRLIVNGEDTIIEHINSALKVGATMHYTFAQPYTVPATMADQPYFLLDMAALLSCDANADNDSIQVVGNVDVIDYGIQSITKPVSGKCSMGGEEVAIEVRLFNNGTVDGTDSLVLTAIIDSANTVYQTITEKIAPMFAGENRTHVFVHKYSVPRLSVNNAQETYTVTVYLAAVEGDVYPSNDTASVESCVEGGVGMAEAEADSWNMGQNMPNPAANVTKVPFVLPEAGTVIFNIMGLNGQVLYREEVSAEAGQNELQVNTADYAAGIYYYSMEYKGQRLVKKMNIVR